MRHHIQKHKNILRQVFNAGLRMGSLGIKLLLTLYMGRYLGLTEMGTYGLVAAIVAVSIPLLGMRIDYALVRQIVDISPHELALRLRDQILFYGLNYLVLIVIAAGVIFFLPHIIDPRIVIFSVMLAIVEGLGTYTSGNLVPLRQPILSNILFFIRSAIWVVPVIGIGIFEPSTRTATFIFGCWFTGAVASLAVTAYAWRKLPWKETLAKPIDWSWIRQSVKTCLPMWLGAMAIALSSNFDRFVSEHYLGRDSVGIVSFYGSFVTAIMSLIVTGVSVFIQPDMIAAYKRGDHVAFRRLGIKMTTETTLGALVLAVVIGIAVPLLGDFLNRPEFSEHALVLWLMLAGVALRASAEGLYHVLYARHQDRCLWTGNLVMLAISVVSNIILVPHYQLIGIGVSALLNGLAVLLWRGYWVVTYRSKAAPA